MGAPVTDRMRILLLFALATTVLVLCACGSAEEAPWVDKLSPWVNPTSPPDWEPRPFETVEIGHQTGVDVEEPDVFAMRTQAQWEEFWSRHKSGVRQAPQPPQVDFSKDMVIAVVDNPEPSAGYGIEVKGIVPDIDVLLVLTKKAMPNSECVVATVIAQPFHIVRTAKSRMSLELVVREETYSCE